MTLLRSMVLICGLAVAALASANDETASDDGLSFDDKLAACAACHGEYGAKPILPEYPVLAGQHADYLASALSDYKSGRRNNPIMAAQIQAMELSDGDIKRLAEYFSQQPSSLDILKN